MHPFQYTDVQSEDQAVALAADPATRFVAGGTTLLDLMKYNLETPARVADINRLPLRGVAVEGQVLRIGALEHMSDVAAHPLVQEHLPVVRDSLLLAASAQLRNMATIGGNILQRTRCGYFREPAFACNKREPGSGCDALAGLSRTHAILGTSPHCIATHASDLAVALAALEATVCLRGPQGEREVAFEDFHRLPADTPHLETVLEPGELITAVLVPLRPFYRRSHYLKLRDRTSYAFALVSVAAALDVQDGLIADVRLGLGGVGTKPWRAHAAEAALRGQPATEATFRRAAEMATDGAVTTEHNAFKVPLVQNAIVHALTVLAGPHPLAPSPAERGN